MHIRTSQCMMHATVRSFYDPAVSAYCSSAYFYLTTIYKLTFSPQKVEVNLAQIYLYMRLHMTFEYLNIRLYQITNTFSLAIIKLRENNLNNYHIKKNTVNMKAIYSNFSLNEEKSQIFFLLTKIPVLLFPSSNLSISPSSFLIFFSSRFSPTGFP